MFTYSTAYSNISDTSRNWDDNGTEVSTRDIPIKAYIPDDSYNGPFPLIMISHGLGGDVETISYMAEYLAAYGYAVVAVQHRRSDAKYLADHGIEALMAAASQPETRILRPQDMTYVLDKIIGGSTGISLLSPGRIDFSKTGVLGHSFGAWTALSVLGQTFDGGIDISDNRFSCGVSYSPQGLHTLGLNDSSWNNLSKPTFTMAGTLDTSPGTPDADDRRTAFESMPSTGAKFHATFIEATHDSFGNPGGPNDGFYHEWIKQLTLAFFDANLLNDSYARSWLEKKSIEKQTSYIIQEKK